MTNSHGIDTRELRALRQPLPAERGLSPKEREDEIQKFGWHCMATGLGILIGSVTLALALAVASGNNLFSGEAAHLFGVLGLVSLAATGTILTAIGGAEHLHRSQRAMTRVILAETKENSERLDVVIGLVSAVPGRLTALERVIEKVPAYGEGVIHGAQLRADALGPDSN